MEDDPYLIDIEHDDDRWNKTIPDNFDIVGKTVEEVFKSHCINRAEVSILLADNYRVQELNAKYRQKNQPTNVLSFPSKAITVETMEAVLAEEEVPMIGDIIVAFETMKKEAEEFDIPLENHLRHLIVHSVLHLLGYDHEEDEEADLMEEVEVEILKTLGVPDPYEN